MHRQVMAFGLLAGLLTMSVGCRAPAAAPDDEAARGAYLVNLLGCARCHTEGYLIGNAATGPALAGSRVGIAYSGAIDETRPGLVFAANLTPDQKTGLGRWTRRDIVRALTTGVGTDGHQRLPVMPWPNYAALRDSDLQAIAAFLQSLPPVFREIPATTTAGDPVEHPYVRIGIYLFTPFDQDPAAP